MAFASVLYPGRCPGVELVNSCAYWELPKGNAQRTQDLSRTFTPAGFPTPPPPVFLLQLRQILPVVRPWWSASAPFTSPAAAAAAAASAKDKAEASAAAAAKANASAMNRAVDWLRQSAAASAVAPAAVSAPAPNLQPNQWGRLCCRSAVPNAQQL